MCIRDSQNDGLINAVQALRNSSERTDACDLFTSVAHTYRAIQEWCAPRILVDGTDAYSATAKLAFSEANNLWSNASFVHLLRNPRECLGEWQETKGAKNLDEVEQKWTQSTKDVLELEKIANARLLQIRYEDLMANKFHEIQSLFSCLSIPSILSSDEDARQLKLTTSYDGPMQAKTLSVAWRLGYNLSRHNSDNFMLISKNVVHGSVVWL